MRKVKKARAAGFFAAVAAMGAGILFIPTPLRGPGDPGPHGRRPGDGDLPRGRRASSSSMYVRDGDPVKKGDVLAIASLINLPEACASAWP